MASQQRQPLRNALVQSPTNRTSSKTLFTPVYLSGSATQAFRRISPQRLDVVIPFEPHNLYVSIRPILLSLSSYTMVLWVPVISTMRFIDFLALGWCSDPFA